jgi:hypothetical protein
MHRFQRKFFFRVPFSLFARPQFSFQFRRSGGFPSRLLYTPRERMTGPDQFAAGVSSPHTDAVERHKGLFRLCLKLRPTVGAEKNRPTYTLDALFAVQIR